jgi:hypothetical protein
MFSWMAAVLTLMGVAAQQDGARDAVALGRSRDQALYSAFHADYTLPASGDVEHVELVTEFRRAVLIVRQHADLGEYSFNENNLTRAMVPFRGLVAFIAQIRLHPLHTLPAPPRYEMYLRTGPATPPVALTGVTRDPLYPPGFHDAGVSFTSFRLEGSIVREAINNAAEPALVIVNDRGDIVWQAPLDLTHVR